jgi:predicted DNA-binding WGR domain protein
VDVSAPILSFTSNPPRDGGMNMPAVILHRIDHDRNMSRYYRLDVQPDLFGEWGVVREWGRIGQAGRYCVDPYPTAAQAEERMQFQQAAKQGRGYARIS